jgi:PAT family beta-lactamase induction signal transducer AmpG
VGIAYGTVGVSALTLGGLLGGWVISRGGLKRLLWPLMLCMHLPNTVFVALAVWQPSNLWLVSAASRWSSSATASASPPTWSSC